MFPILATAFVAASFAGSVYSNQKQYQMEKIGIELEVEQARLQASEQAYERTKRFRQNTSMNLALQGMGFGSSGNLAGAAAEGFQNYMQDIKSLKTAENYAILGGNAKKVGARSNKTARNLGAFESSASLASKLGLFGG